MNKPNQDLLEVDITDLAPGGKGLGRCNGKVIFVEKGIPGQRVTVQLYKNRKDYAEGRVAELLENSPLYQEPRCTHFTLCGGCSLQNMLYEEQISYKQQWIVETLRRIGGITGAPVQETVPSPDLYFYRNRMEFSFSDKVWDPVKKKIQPDSLGLGLHLSGRYDTVINIEECFLQSHISNGILQVIREFALSSGLPAYKVQIHKGFWRFLVIREGKLTGERLVNIITNGCSENKKRIIKDLADIVRKKFPEVSAFFHAEHSGKSQAAIWESIGKVYGKDFIQERVGSYNFRIDCGTFFQTNSRQTEKLYDLVKAACSFTGNETVYDLFSGVGTIPIYISASAGKIVGFELNPISVEAARANTRLNNVTNCQFIRGKVRSLIKYAPELFKKFGKPDVIIANPPRSGIDQKTLERIVKLNAGRIVYVSCSPATLARDLKVLSNTYSIDNIVPVDLFPHTAHIESVTTLVRKRSN